MNTATQNEIPYQADYWNDEGGRRWLRNLDALEAMLAPLGEALLERADPRPGEAVLDVGCGGGRMAARIAQGVGAGGSVLAVDISAMLIERAQREYGATPGLTLRLADAATAPLGSGRFDLVFSRFGVMFFADPVAAFARLRDALRPGGRFVFLCWQGRELNPWMYAPAAAAFEHVPAPPPPGPEDPGPFSLGDPARVRAILGAAGFSDAALEPHTGPLRLGPVDDALAFISTMGPAAQPLAEATPAARAAALAAMRAVLAAHDSPEGVQMPCATWLVCARRP
jgi:SAM-dependent methyltransferase